MATVDDVGEDEKARLASSRAWALILAPQLQKEDRHCCRACQGRRVQGCLAEQVAVFGGEVGFTGSAVHGGLCTLYIATPRRNRLPGVTLM